MSAPLTEIVAFLDKECDIASFDDSSVNGLQVEGPTDVTRVGLAVDACMNSFMAAIEAGCQLLVVHHGLFWSKGLRSLTGVDYRRIATLVENKLALYGCHLPLDAHPTFGNNAQLAKILDLADVRPFARYQGSDIGVMGDLTKEASASDVAARLEAALHDSAGIACKAGVVGDATRPLKRLGIVSGGGTLAIHEAVAAGLDALVTGEGPHHANVDALDNSITLIYGGHYETETLGVKALGELVGSTFSLDTVFLDVPH